MSLATGASGRRTREVVNALVGRAGALPAARGAALYQLEELSEAPDFDAQVRIGLHPVGHHAVAEPGTGQQLGRGAGGDDAVVEADGAGGTVGARHLEGVRVEERAAAVDLRDLVLLHQVVDALDPAVRDLPAAAEGLPVVEGDLALGPDAEGLRLAREDVREFGVA